MRRFGLIGKTLKHSFSQTYFTRKFSEEGITGCRYDNFELPEIDALQEVLQLPGLAGFNITIPYKEAVLSFLHEKDEAVDAIGAANCVHLRDGRLIGYNTDAPAFQQSLKGLLQPHHDRALVLGTGGASKAVQYALQQLCLPYQVVSRSGSQPLLSYNDIDESLLATHTIVINTTPLGMYPDIDTAPPLPFDAVTPAHLFYDLTYNPEVTKFLRLASEKGAAVQNGYQMLVLQAEESWRIWNA